MKHQAIHLTWINCRVSQFLFELWWRCFIERHNGGPILSTNDICLPSTICIFDMGAGNKFTSVDVIISIWRERKKFVACTYNSKFCPRKKNCNGNHQKERYHFVDKIIVHDFQIVMFTLFFIVVVFVLCLKIKINALYCFSR